MEQEYLNYFRMRLNKKLRKLLGYACNTVSEMTGQSQNFPDPSDRATLEANRNFELRIRDREYKLIGKVRKAIRRISEGTFGICDKCGGNISKDRLEVRPVTTQCIECKTIEEALEKALGL